jgi:hypothetical protein
MDSTNVYAYISIISLVLCIPPAILVRLDYSILLVHPEALVFACALLSLSNMV